MGNYRALWHIRLAGIACTGLVCSCHEATPSSSPSLLTIDPDPTGSAQPGAPATDGPASSGSAAAAAPTPGVRVASRKTLAAIGRCFELQASIANEPTIEVKGTKDAYDIRLSSRTRQILPDVKHACREAVRLILGESATASLSDEALSAHITETFKQVNDSDGGMGVRVHRQPGHPERIGVMLSLPSPYGTDDSVYIFDTHAETATELTMAIEANGYESITGAQYALAFAISPPDEGGQYFVVTAHASPWISSDWRGIKYRVFEPTARPDAPKLLLSERDEAWLSGNEIASVKADRATFEVRFWSTWTKDQAVPQREHVRHYTRIADGFVRTQPVVTQALYLPDEWLHYPWSEAKSWTTAPASTALQGLHARLRDPRLEPSARITYSVVGEMADHILIEMACQSCAKFPKKVLFEIVADGPSFTIASVTEANR
jgi:hypothetical protein